MIAEILCGKTEYDAKALAKEDNYLYAHREMIAELYSNGKVKNMEEAMKRVTDKVNQICKNILLNTSVFKKDEDGYKGFNRFMNSVGIVQKI